MRQSEYTLKYLPVFYADLTAIIDYIINKLQNPAAVNRFLDNIDKAITERLNCPLSFEPFQSNRKRKNPYYRIYVDNFTVYYVVTGKVMEVRRILYSRRDADSLIK